MGDSKCPFVRIYTDGGCRGNPGPGAWAAILEWGDHRKEITGYEAETTNNRMELSAAIHALQALNQRCRVELLTDSEYLRRGVTEWLPAWLERGWRTASRTPVRNRDLWETLHALVGKHEVRWDWVRGHSGHPENERCDELVKQVLARDGVD